MADPTRDGTTEDGERLTDEPLRPVAPAPTSAVTRDTANRAGDTSSSAAAGDPTSARAIQPALPATVRIASRGRAPAVLSGAIVIFLVGALWKPWAPPARDRPLIQGPIPSPTATASPGPDELLGLGGECDDPGGWRVYSREGFLDQVVRVWRSVEPATSATGPLDPKLPLVQVGPDNESLGYCAPWRGAERPPADSVVSVWHLVSGPGDSGTASEPERAIAVRLVRIMPARPTVLGALYGDPTGRPGPLDGRAGGWTDGQYVFAIRAPGWERWWAVEVSAPRSSRSAPSASPASSATP